MATTRIIPMHQNKGKTIAQCLRDRTEYAKNPDKTAHGELVSSFACDPKTVETEFLLSKKEYAQFTGRSQARDVIAYQVRQSFRPGEITPEDANRVGCEFARRFLKENHAFIVATHIDKAHVHNHIIWNSTNLNCDKKFRNFWGSTKAVMQLSDLICVEHGLSIVESPKDKGVHYGKWLGDQKQPSHRERLCAAIDSAMERKPADLDALIVLLTEAGYEVKRGKQLAFRGPEQKRFIRLGSLGDGYTQEALLAVLSGGRNHVPRSKSNPAKWRKPAGKVSLLVDIQAKLQAGKGAGYEHWAKVFNLKQMAQTMNYLAEQGLTDYDDLCTKTSDVKDRFSSLSKEIRAMEVRLSEIAVLRTHILNYIKTRDVYADYHQHGYSARYRAAHEQEIVLHQDAKKYFDSLCMKKLPTIKKLNTEYTALLAEKKSAYVDYHRAKEEKKSLLTAKANVDRILEIDEKKMTVHPKKTVERSAL